MGFKAGYLMLLPALVLMGVFVLFPTVWGLYVSMTDTTLVGPSAIRPRFVWLGNYLRLLRDGRFYNSLNISFAFTIGSALIGQLILGLVLAIMMRVKELCGRSLAALAVFVSWIVPEVVAGYMWGSFASKRGLLNLLLSPLGVRPTNWLFYRPLETIIVANVWRGTAFSMILFSAALESIPGFIYEASELDGATPWQRFRYVTLPLLLPAILTDLILITIWTFGVFTMPFVMTGGGPGTKSELWTIYVYKQSFLPPYELGYAAAAANIMFVITLSLIVTYVVVINKLKRW